MPVRKKGKPLSLPAYRLAANRLTAAAERGETRAAGSETRTELHQTPARFTALTRGHLAPLRAFRAEPSRAAEVS